MSLQKKIARQLETARNEEAFTAKTVVADHEGDQIRVDLLAVDSIGCAFERLTLQSSQLNQLSADQLQQLAADLARRITYLLEPIRTVEVDAEHRIVQMRSEKTQQSDDGRFYYEVIAQPGLVQLSRYKQAYAEARVRTASRVTVEVLLRLIDDLVAASAGTETGR